MTSRRLLHRLGLLLVLPALPGFFCAAESIHIKKNETAPDVLVSISDPVTIDGRALQGVFAAGSNVTISGQVTGDVAVIGGDLKLLPGSEIKGDVLLLGSRYEIAESANIYGKRLVSPFLGDQIHELFRDPAGFFFRIRLDFSFIATSLFFSVFWFLLSLAVIRFFPAHVAFACSRIKQDPSYLAGMGLLTTAGLVVILVISLALCMILIGIPLFILLLLFALIAWLFGMVILFCVTGEWILRLLRFPRITPLISLLAAILFWTGLKFLPGVSFLVHLAAFCLSMGITFSTRFGTGTPWLRRRPQQPLQAPRPS